MIVCFSGHKRWFFVPPFRNFWSRKPVAEWFATDYADMPLKPSFQCVQNPRDIIYIPDKYGHAVLNLEETVGVAAEMRQA